MKRRIRDQEEGAALIIALVFLTIFGTFVPVLLDAASTHVKVTGVARGNDAKLYGADGGIEYGIQRLRTDATLCTDASTGLQSLGSVSVNPGVTVNVQCEATEGNGIAGPSVTNGYAIITSAPPAAGNLTTLIGEGNGVGTAINVDGGRVFTAGSPSLGHPMILAGGDFIQKPEGTCPASPPANLTVQPPNTWVCDAAVTTPTLAVALPDAPPDTAPAPIVTGAGASSCQIFYPGKYTAANPPNFGAAQSAYFASGIYYFEDTGQVLIGNTHVVGGEPSPGENLDLPDIRKCADDFLATTKRPSYVVKGTGVEWIFGGSSGLYLNVQNQSHLELFSRRADPAFPEGKDGVSIYAVRSGASCTPASPCWKTWSGSAFTSGSVFEMEKFTDAVLHGALYAWESPVWFKAGQKAAVKLQGGIAVRTLTLEVKTRRPSEGPLDIRIPGAPPTPRTVRLTATAQHAGSGDAPVVIRAMVLITPSAPGTFDASVQSWRKCPPAGCA